MTCMTVCSPHCTTCMNMNAEAKRFLRLRYYPHSNWWVSEHLFLFPLTPRPSPFLGLDPIFVRVICWFVVSLCRWGLGFLRILLERLFCVVPATLLQRVGGSKAIDSEAPNQTSDILEHLGHNTAEALPTGCIFYIQWNPGSTRGVFLTLVLDRLWLAKVVANIRAEVMGRRCVGNPSIFWSVILARLSCHWLYYSIGFYWSCNCVCQRSGSRRLWNSKEGQWLQVGVLLLCSLCYNLCQLFQQEVLPCSASCLLVLWLYRVPSMCNKLRMMRFGQEIKILNGFTLRRISLFSAFWKSHHAAST